MATTLKRSYRYPSQGVEPDAAGDIQKLAEDVAQDVDTIATDVSGIKAKTIPAAVQAGTVTVTVANGASSGSAQVTFPKAFTTTPFITATYNGVAGSASTSRRLQPRVSGQTATGCTISLETSDGSNVGSSFAIPVSWIAVLP